MSGTHRTQLNAITGQALCEILANKGIITHDQLEIALVEQKNSREQPGRILVRLGFVTEAIIHDVIGGVFGQNRVDLQSIVADSEAIAMIPEEMARRLRVVPVSYDAPRRVLKVALADTFDIVALDRISAHLGGAAEVVPVLAAEADIENSIDRFYGYELSVDGILNEIETGELDYRSLAAQSNEYSQPVVRLVNALLSDAVKRGASDIHFEPEQGFLRFRYRIDGVLRQVRSLHKNYWSALAVRVKVMAGLDIAESRLPQDGRISLIMSGRQVDFRVSTLPTLHGENIVLRVLDRQKGIVALDQLGLGEADLAALKGMVERPEGLILVTGPTGSGKTTTLYSILQYLNSESVNIMTLEDPVEYPTSMIRQTSANAAARLGFADGIRSILRQDPDIILVGEIRDEDTAAMAVRAAMTGHQVFTTLHSNSAVGAIPRLLDIGVRPEILAGNIIGAVAQRLVRRLCDDCKEPAEMKRIPPGTDFKSVPLFSDCKEPVKMKRPQPANCIRDAEDRLIVYRPVGCPACAGQGYRGRMALMEILPFDPDMDELIARRGTSRELHGMAVAKGFRPLAESGKNSVIQGKTSLAEVARVVDLSSSLGQDYP
ncbi:MAG: GspE/PulE family protein [Gammaproteobacteria bacterium]|nr:GspE/PulE family protein [Gammaproteobacteria bacterium]MDE0283620.1 GspE/PulE family protein [Gammaproteobacteria bacterium]